MKTLLCLLVLTALAIVATADVNVTGKWSGSFNITGPDGSSKESTALLILKQNGTEITGSVGPSEAEQHPIQKGRIDGDKIALEAQDVNNNRVIKFDLLIVEDRIKGEATMSANGESRKAKLDVGRAK
jgi:hypothetical protein